MEKLSLLPLICLFDDRPFTRQSLPPIEGGSSSQTLIPYLIKVSSPFAMNYSPMLFLLVFLSVLEYIACDAYASLVVEVKTAIQAVRLCCHLVSWWGLFIFFNILETSTVISGWAPTCDSMRSWQYYSAAPMGNQTTSNMTQFPTQSHYPDSGPTSP